MKIFYSAASPFVRKCLVAAHELGLADRIELVPARRAPGQSRPDDRRRTTRWARCPR